MHVTLPAIDSDLAAASRSSGPVSSDPASASREEREAVEAYNASTFAAAAARASFDLTYGRAERPRRFVVDGIESIEEIDNSRYGHVANAPATSSADWNNDGDGDVDLDLDNHGRLRRVNEQDWFDDFARSAVGDGVHEVLEWLRVDGQLWLDPHDPDVETAIRAEVDALARRLATLRERHRRREELLDQVHAGLVDPDAFLLGADTSESA